MACEAIRQLIRNTNEAEDDDEGDAASSHHQEQGGEAEWELWRAEEGVHELHDSNTSALFCLSVFS